MGLKQNGHLLAQMPLTQRLSSDLGPRSQWTHSGPMRNWFVGGHSPDQKSGRPNGHLHPSSFRLPQQSGGMSSYSYILGDGEFAAAGAMGVNGEADLAGVGSLDGVGELVVSAAAALIGTGALTANVVASLNGAADLVGSGDISGAVVALGHALATIAGTGQLNLTPYAVGFMEADITPFTELSPQNLARAVAEYNIEGDLSLEEIIRVILAAVAGETSGVGSSNELYKSQDGTKNRIDATFDGSNNRTTVTLDPS